MLDDHRISVSSLSPSWSLSSSLYPVFLTASYRQMIVDCQNSPRKIVTHTESRMKTCLAGNRMVRRFIYLCEKGWELWNIARSENNRFKGNKVISKHCLPSASSLNIIRCKRTHRVYSINSERVSKVRNLVIAHRNIRVIGTYNLLSTHIRSFKG